jgi:H+/gluconate symporter-like permease
MYSLLIFCVTIVLVSYAVIRYKVPPFLVLFSGSLFFGIASGMPLPDLILNATAGMGRVFALLGLVILSGAVIAKLMQEQHHVGRIVADLQSVARRPFTLSGIAGYLVRRKKKACSTPLP